jgi:hypothetical protein
MPTPPVAAPAEHRSGDADAVALNVEQSRMFAIVSEASCGFRP